MLNKLVSWLLVILTAVSPSLVRFLNLPQLPRGQTLDMSKFELVWSDEFDGEELDKSKWGYEWWVTERKGGYWHEDMVSVEDGDLVIRAEYKDEPMDFKYGDIDWVKPYKSGYYTGMITSQGKYEQCRGYFECRCVLPAGTGMWSSFWMMNEGVFNVDGFGNDGTEVDVYESMYYNEHWCGLDSVIGGIHFDGYEEFAQGDSTGRFFVKGNPYKEYNTYGLEWNEDEYIFYINGVETGRTSKGGVSDNLQYLLLSVEIAGHDGIADADRHGTGRITHTPKNNWPVEYRVDYVRCYQYK